MEIIEIVITFVIIPLLSIIFVVVAPFIFIFNFFVARVFMSKREFTASDLLIITGLIGDGVYGFILSSTPLIIYFSQEMEGDFVKKLPLIWLNLDSFSTLFSLLMILVMTLNRYYAVVKPFQYKIYFCTRNVLLMIFLVLIISFIFPMVGVIALYYDNTTQGTFVVIPFDIYDFYIFIWPQLQLFIIIVDTVLMVSVYLQVAKSYNLRIASCFVKRKSPKNQLKGTIATTDVNPSHVDEYNGQFAKIKNL